jgi:hypothetical protein
MSYRGHIKNGVAVLDTPVDLPDGTPVRIEVLASDGEFWRQKTIDELAAEQQVQRADGLESLAGDWPNDDSVEELLMLLRRVRN